MPRYRLTVNGRQLEADVPSEMPLLWVLRDHLDLTGTKYGCGKGLCGACLVHVSGRPVQSCLLPVSDVGDRPVTTIEGLAGSGGTGLQEAWVETGVPQCGYCQPGQLMQAAALLERSPEPDDDEIRGAMRANLCRCGTYLRITEAIRRAAGRNGEEGS